LPNAHVNGIDTYYEDEGRGVPVLFIHGGFGGAESALFWKPSSFKGLLPPDRFRVITYDRRGGGRSTFVHDHYGLKDLAKDARALLQHLGIERCIVVGDSLGGVVAQRFALDYPDVVESLLLVETGSRIFTVPKKVKALLLAARFLPMRPFFRLIRPRALEPEFYDPLGPLTADEIEERRRHHAEYKARLRELSDDDLYHYSMGLLRNYAAFAGVDLSSEVGALKCPIDIMHGTADRVVYFDTGASMLQNMRHARFHELEGLGHGLFYYPEGREAARAIIEEQAADLSPASSAAAAD
jgi:pimeloyl-ACP methyl ester carboxylesterase